jgi:hypothetical protein
LSRALSQSGAHAAALAAASHARQEAEKLVNDDVLWRAQVAEAEALRRLRERPKALAAASGAVPTNVAHCCAALGLLQGVQNRQLR